MAERTEKMYIADLPHGRLYATEDSMTAEKLSAAGVPVLGILTGENEKEPFTGVRYLIGKDTLADTEYLDQVLCRMKGLPVRVLETKRCILRESMPEDAEDFCRIYEDTEVKKYMEPLYELTAEQEYLKEYAENVYAFYEYGIWTVVLKENGRIIGRAGIDPVEKEGPQLGYVIEKEYRGRGIAGEVCRAVTEYAFRTLSIERITAVTHRENTASRKLLSALHFEETESPKEQELLTYVWNAGKE